MPSSSITVQNKGVRTFDALSVAGLPKPQQVAAWVKKRTEGRKGRE